MRRRYMHDDLLGLNALRMFPEATMSVVQATPQRPTVSPASSFASHLAKQLRNVLNFPTAGQPIKPYVSPFLQTRPNPTLQRPTAPSTPLRPPTTTTARPWNPFLPDTSTPITPTRPLAPVQKPQAPAPLPTNPHAPLPLGAYPPPNGDNGRGMHWIPTTDQSPAAIDRFVAEAQKMGVKWVTFLNNGADIGKNDYLVQKLVGAGIEPIMRLWTSTLSPIQGDVEGMVHHYLNLGVHYFQPFNEPNLNAENPDGEASVDRYLDNWIPAAQAILRGGGLPGFGSMAPGGDIDDIQFLTQALDGLKQRGQLGLLDKGWLSMHNYTHNHPIDPVAGSDGFFKFNTYHQVLSNALGRDLPIIGTEGGTFVGEQEDASMPAADANTVAQWATQAYTYMRDQRAPWNFAYSFWTIANDAGGGSDPRFNAEALFHGDGSQSQVVSALQTLTRG